MHLNFAFNRRCEFGLLAKDESDFIILWKATVAEVKQVYRH